ncbi:NAD-dependent epimerase/dehydratase family protein [Candidatus Peregrinibacteria bacterium]|nr:NAD-dependent epimerase/dehydratase family protein [Candidatus Peregrinibacteria bacterium]
METVIVTGGAGFIGSHTVDLLVNNGYRVVIIDNLSNGRKANIHPAACFYNMDICDPQLCEIFQKESVDYVIHLAAQIHVNRSVLDPVLDSKINIEGTLRILEQCRQHSVKKIIFSSSGGAIYGETDQIPTRESCRPSPVSPYAIAKLSAEYYLRYYFETHKLPFVALRYANVYGPRQDLKGEGGVVAIFIEKMLKKEKIMITGDGKQTRDFVFVADVASANLAALQSDATGLYNIGSGIETDILTLYSLLKELIGFDGDLSFGTLPQAEIRRSCLDSSLALDTLSFKTSIDLQDGLYETISWWNSYM